MNKNRNTRFQIPGLLMVTACATMIVSDHPDWGFPIAAGCIIISVISIFVIALSHRKKDTEE